jgi:SAM-dependent methyltransferase
LRAVLSTESALGRGDLAFVHLLHSLRTGDAAFPRLYGRDFWADIAADPQRTAEYDEHMGHDVAAWAPPVADAYDWSARRHVVDVGGGNGTFLAHVLQRFGRLRGTVFDQPATAAAARATLREAGVEDRADVVGGDFFAPWPAGADTYVLCAVLHDWADEPARAVLRRAAEAVRDTDGRVLVIEKAGPGGTHVSSAMDLRVLVYFGARERDVPELVTLAEGTGLRTTGTFLAGDLAIVELAPD